MKSRKLSFWASHVPSVDLVSLGDPAAVLDLDDDSIKWYPTNLDEYAEVGHYYLLNERHGEALERYEEALRKVGDRAEDARLKARIQLWCAVCCFALHQEREAEAHLVSARELWPQAEIATGAEVTSLPQEVERDLAVDHDLLATMLSMNQVSLAARWAEELSLKDAGLRGLQARCFLALIDQAISDANRFTRRTIAEILPETLATMQPSGIRPLAMIEGLVEVLSDSSNLDRLDRATRRWAAERLGDLARSVPKDQPRIARRLALASAAFYRELRDFGEELEALRLAHSIAPGD